MENKHEWENDYLFEQSQTAKALSDTGISEKQLPYEIFQRLKVFKMQVGRYNSKKSESAYASLVKIDVEVADLIMDYDERGLQKEPAGPPPVNQNPPANQNPPVNQNPPANQNPPVQLTPHELGEKIKAKASSGKITVNDLLEIIGKEHKLSTTMRFGNVSIEKSIYGYYKVY